MDLTELSDAAEAADDEYGVAVGAAGEAAADYEYVYWTQHAALLHLPSEAARNAASEEVAVNEKVAKVRAEAEEKRCKKHVDVLLARLSAEQTKVRFEGGLS